MADYTKSQKGVTNNYPTNSIDAKDWTRVEPLLSVQLLKDRFLVGIPLVSDTVDPITKRRQVFTEDILKDLIEGAVNQAEMDLGIDIFPVQRSENYPFDRNLFVQWGYLKTEHAPILSVDSLSVNPGGAGTSSLIYNVPLDWISTLNYRYGQINIVPIMPVSTTNFSLSPAGQGGGAVFLAFLNQMSWLPVFWDLVYTTGFADGQIPRVVNDLIGCYASIEVLGMLQATNSANSRSLSLDGTSQSVSTAGPDKFGKRIEQLEMKKKALTGKVKALFGKKFVLGSL